MVTALPPALAGWREAPRCRPLNTHGLRGDGAYVLCWLQSALRARDNPAIDAAVRLGEAAGRPVLLLHELREDAPYASDRLHRFALGAMRDLARDARARGLACVAHVDRDGAREPDLAERLATQAVAVVIDDQPSTPARAGVDRLTERAEIAAFAVDAACLVPSALLGEARLSTSGFRKRHVPLRAEWADGGDETATKPPYDGPLPFTPTPLADRSDADLDRLVSAMAIDHSLPPSPAFTPGREGAAGRLRRLAADVLPGYASARNDATRGDGAGGLSPYLHFGVVGPREVMAAVDAADAPPQDKAKFADELLTWREWYRHEGRLLGAPERWGRVSAWARDTLAVHADDPRPETETFAALLYGETRDETWNACQRQFLIDGWMHNNLRMYWAKRLIALTPDPETAWATACHLNDRLSLDGRDPSTWGNIAGMFGGGAPGPEQPIYGRVPARSDGSTRHRADGAAWLAAAATRKAPRPAFEERPPTDVYLEV